MLLLDFDFPATLEAKKFAKRMGLFNCLIDSARISSNLLKTSLSQAK